MKVRTKNNSVLFKTWRAKILRELADGAAVTVDGALSLVPLRFAVTKKDVERFFKDAQQQGIISSQLEDSKKARRRRRVYRLAVSVDDIQEA